MNTLAWALSFAALSAVLLWALGRVGRRLRAADRRLRDFRRELSTQDGRLNEKDSQMRWERLQHGLALRSAARVTRLFELSGQENARKVLRLREENVALAAENEVLMGRVERLALEASRLPSPASLEVELARLVEQDR